MNRPLIQTKASGWLLPLDRSGFHVAFIFLLCLVLYFLFLGARDFWEAENQYAEIVRVMLLDGDYALPKVNGTLWADNPPLYFWLALLFSWMAGQVNEWTVRLPSALSATALILSFYLFSRKWFDARVAPLQIAMQGPARRPTRF